MIARAAFAVAAAVEVHESRLADVIRAEESK